MFFKTARNLRLQKGVDEPRPTSGAVPSPHFSLLVGLCEAAPGVSLPPRNESSRQVQLRPKGNLGHLAEVGPSKEKNQNMK